MTAASVGARLADTADAAIWLVGIVALALAVYLRSEFRLRARWKVARKRHLIFDFAPPVRERPRPNVPFWIERES